MTVVLAPPCADNPELFFSEQAEAIQRAQQICAGCWRLPACQDDVADETPEYGVWAGINFTPAPDEDETARKNCNSCGQTKPLTEFRRHAGRRDGREARCIACTAISDAARVRPKRMRGVHAERRQARLDELAVRAAQLRDAGLTYLQIGQQIGVCRQNAANAVQRAYTQGLVPMEAAS